MRNKRLVIWISASILGFQGATLALDLINCTALGWITADQKTAKTSRAAQRFCAEPQARVDQAVKQGLSVIAGLALGTASESADKRP